MAVQSIPSAFHYKVPENAFGKVKWKELFGLDVEEPVLPVDIDKILTCTCPFFPGKQVAETHCLTLVPVDMTLEKLEILTLNAKNKIGFTKNELAWSQLKKVSSGIAHWVLMPHDVIPGSRSRTWEDQQKLAKTYEAQGYKLLSIIDGAHSFFLEYMQTGKRFYSDNPYTYTRCSENVSEESSQWPAAIGGFTSGGLHIRYDISVGASKINGLGLARLFY